MRLPPESDHAAAKSKWPRYSKQAKRSVLPRELSIRAFTLYRVRFIFAADLCEAWSKFGGLAPHLSHISTALYVGIAESVGTALSYRRLVGLKLQEKARKRTAIEADFVSVLAAGNFAINEQAKKEISRTIGADQKTNATVDRDPKRKGRGRKGDKNGQPCQPRRFVARFEANKNDQTPRIDQHLRSGETNQQRQPSRPPQKNRRRNNFPQNQQQSYVHQANQNHYRHPRRQQNQQQR